MWSPIASPPASVNPYSQTEVLNRKFKRVAWSTSLLFLGVIALLILELIGVIPVSPLQPNIKVGVRSLPVPTQSDVNHLPASPSDPARR